VSSSRELGRQLEILAGEEFGKAVEWCLSQQWDQGSTGEIVLEEFFDNVVEP
jgi:hypothetical protein